MPNENSYLDFHFSKKATKNVNFKEPLCFLNSATLKILFFYLKFSLCTAKKIISNLSREVFVSKIRRSDPASQPSTSKS